jgi:transcription elongation factor GreA
MADKIPMTKAGAEKLRVELEELKRVKRPQIVEAIAVARAHGDLKENAEYHAAKEQQALIEGRINKLESDLSHCQVIDVATMDPTERVVFGVTVELLNVDNDQEVKYQIVGEDEADLKHGKISYRSPIARGLIGKQVGDEVEVQTPSGSAVYEILAVHYV